MKKHIFRATMLPDRKIRISVVSERAEWLRECFKAAKFKVGKATERKDTQDHYIDSGPLQMEQHGKVEEFTVSNTTMRLVSGLANDCWKRLPQ